MIKDIFPDLLKPIHKGICTSSYKLLIEISRASVYGKYVLFQNQTASMG